MAAVSQRLDDRQDFSIFGPSKRVSRRSELLPLFAAAQLDHGRWWLALGGLASIAYGVLLIIAPLIGALVLTWWLGAYALVFGVLLLVLAFRLRTKHDARRQSGLPQGAM
jgi:Flp pilus assembly protein TadB